MASREKKAAPWFWRIACEGASMKLLVGARRMKGWRSWAASSAVALRKAPGSHWRVRMTGMAAADQEPIWRVRSGVRMASLKAQWSGVQMARASLGQASSSGVICSTASGMSGQRGGLQQQTGLRPRGRAGE